MKINYHIITQKDNKDVLVQAFDGDYEHACKLIIALRNVFTEAEGWSVFLENVNGEKL